MKRVINVSTAKSIAEKFLSRERTFERASGGPPRPHRILDCSAVLWWDDATVLYEFPFEFDDGVSRGYVVIPSTRQLAPVLEYSFSGPPLSAQLHAYLTAALTSLGEAPLNVQWYYWSPIEIVAKVALDGTADAVLLEIPSLRYVRVPSDLQVKRDAATLWNNKELGQLWADLEKWPGIRTSSSRAELWYHPVRYQQGCDGYGKECKLDIAGGGTTYCSPHCIAGCTCVAWAMLASSWKKHGQGGANTKIWPGSACWNLEWPSSTNPNRCQDVSDSIWSFHSLMETSCNGATSWGNIIRGGSYFQSRWGLPWQWGERDNIGIADAQEFINHGQPFMFSALGQWQAYRAKAKIKEPTGGPGKEGHSIVAYGYDTSNQAIEICLGWGSSFADKWISIGAYDVRKAVFVHSWGVSAKSTHGRCAVAELDQPDAEKPLTTNISVRNNSGRA